MRVSVDLVFRSLLVFACFLFPLIGFFVARRKLRLAAARGEEIKLLLALAAEEDSRLEFEVAATYYDDVFSAPPSPPPPEKESDCAMCYCPTTTRCARCNAVRYCSGKCQIVYWRQCHRENCHPAPIVDPHGESDEGKKVIKNNHKPDADKFETRQSTDKYSRESGTPASGCPPEVQCVKVDETEDENLANRKENSSPTGSSATSFSGFSTPTKACGSSDDVSVGESVSSFDLDRADTHQSVSGSLDILQNSFNLEQINQSRPVSPKLASLVDSADGFAKLSKSNQVKPNCSNGEDEQELNSSSGVLNNRRTGPATKACTSSDFWGTFDSFESESKAESISYVSSKNKISPSGSSTRISSSVSDATLVSGGRGSLGVSVKSGNGHVVEASGIVSSQVTRSSNDKTGLKTSVFKVFDQLRGPKTSKHNPMELGSEIAEKHAEKELILYDVFVKLYNWNKVELHPSGLINCGNT